MNRTALTIRMLQILAARDLVKKNELAEILETNPRNISEFKNELEQAGYSIEVVNGKHGGYRLNREHLISAPQLSKNEIDALKRVFSSLLTSHEISYSPLFKQALSALSSSLYSVQGYDVRSYSNVRLNVDPSFYQHCIELCLRGIEERRRVRLIYKKVNSQKKEYIIEPYECITIDGIWYVFTYLKYGDRRTFRLNRIEEIELLDETFVKASEVLSGKSLNEFGYAIEKPVHLHCIISDNDYLAEYIWGENQKITWIKPGVFELEVDFNSKFRCIEFARKAITDIQIIEPQWLIEKLIDDANKLLDNYRSQSA